MTATIGKGPGYPVLTAIAVGLGEVLGWLVGLDHRGERRPGEKWLGGPKGTRTLERLRRKLLHHNDAIVAVVLLLIGASILGEGLTQLG